MSTGDTISELIVELRSKDGATRERARASLVKLGKPAVSSLIGLLSDKKELMRWEACKALASIKDPRAIGPLVDALRDRSMDIRWLAGKGLIALGTRSIIPLLQALKLGFDSVPLREGAHHVLNALQRQRLLNASTVGVLDTLKSLGGGRGGALAVAAERALDSLRKVHH